MRNRLTGVVVIAALGVAPACSKSKATTTAAEATPNDAQIPWCGTEGLPSCLDDGAGCSKDDECRSRWCSGGTCLVARHDDGVRNGDESDVDCGGSTGAPKCAEGRKCNADGDCIVACDYQHRCIDTPSCKPHLGGDTCGKGEVGDADAEHESCCRTLPVRGFTDTAHPGKAVFLDKYEITAGRVRAFLAAIAAENDGRPNVQGWVTAHPPHFWDPAWNKFLPASQAEGKVHVARNLLGDVRGESPDEPPPPAADQDENTGLDYQFNSQMFVYIHGNNCGTQGPSSFGFPTWFYPPDVLARQGNPGDSYPPRADGHTPNGAFIPANELLDVKSMNCITNAMLQAFCAWDGGQLATDAVLDYVTGSPPELEDDPGCGTQIGSENPPKSEAAMSGGRCADLRKINATYDAGGQLPVPNFPLNENNYIFPFFAEGTMHDKAWQVAAPGRGTDATGGEPIDMVRLAPGDEPWMDLAGNLNEVVLKTNGSAFTGRFGLKYRGIGFQSARSKLNMNTEWPGEGGLRRIERPEARAAFAGGRCMRFK